MKKTLLAATVITLMASQTVAAEGFEFDIANLYVSAGVNANTADDENNFKVASGYQISAGYMLPFTYSMFKYAAEVGYMDSGDFDGKPSVSGATIVTPASYNAAGIWLAGVVSTSVTDTIDLSARIGFDLGDDDGLMYGGGLTYDASEMIDLNLEYVFRDNSESAQLNLVYAF
jgi:hypothetical protein